VYQTNKSSVNAYTWDMFTPANFLTPTLVDHPREASVTRILAAAFNAVEPGAAVKRYLLAHPLPSNKRTFAFGLGKAACAMTQAVTDSIDIHDTLIITKYASCVTELPATVIEGDHPIPGDSSLTAGRAALEFVSHLTSDDLLICLISGGGSALMTSPVIPLSELQSLTSALLACGARVDEINILRRHLDHLKGGGIAQAANGAQIISLILSDVVGDPIEGIASGPTAPDPSTSDDAITILHKYGLAHKIDKKLRETAKPKDPIFIKVHNQIIGSNEIALHAAQIQAEQEGFSARIVNGNLQGEACEVGKSLAIQLKEELKIRQRPFCLLAGGETTVTVKGGGKGGRNQELALGSVEVLSGIEDSMLISIATDGEDGPTDAAGVVATDRSAQRAESLGLAAAEYLSNNNAYVFFDGLGDLIKTGPSGTNVNDLVICLAF
jgi:glycerate 2-kinase